MIGCTCPSGSVAGPDRKRDQQRETGDDPPLHRRHGGLGTVAGPESPQEVRDVGARGALRDFQARGDLAIVQSLHDQREHLPLPRRELVPLVLRACPRCVLDREHEIGERRVLLEQGGRAELRGGEAIGGLGALREHDHWHAQRGNLP